MQTDVFYIILVTAVLCGFCVLCGNAFKKADVMEKPKGLVNLAVLLVDTINGMVVQNTNSEMAKKLAPYVCSISMYILVSNLMGLLSLSSPTGNYSVTLSLALITFVWKEIVCLRTNGFKSYMHAFIEPIVPFIIPNFFGKVAPLLSMSLRLFGNILSGTIIMTLVYAFTGWLSSFIPVIGGFNFIGPIIAPVLHAYFDVFSGCIQMFIFITLTQVLIGNELPVD